MIKIIAGSGSRKLAYDLSIFSGIEYLDAQTERFADQELRVQLANPLYGDDAVIIQSTGRPANDNLMELLLLADAAKHAGAGRITALIPYFGYGRQDRSSHEWGSISARLVATLLEASGVDNIITLDLHSQRIEDFFNVSVQNIDPLSIFTKIIEKSSDLVIVSPDAGSFMRAKKLSENLGAGFATMNKIRKEFNNCQMESLVGEIAGKRCLIVDDIIDTGETLYRAAILLKENGASQVNAVVTHAALSDTAMLKLNETPIGSIITTNSITHAYLPPKFIVLDIIPAMARSLNP